MKLLSSKNAQSRGIRPQTCRLGSCQISNTAVVNSQSSQHEQEKATLQRKTTKKVSEVDPGQLPNGGTFKRHAPAAGPRCSNIATTVHLRILGHGGPSHDEPPVSKKSGASAGGGACHSVCTSPSPLLAEN